MAAVPEASPARGGVAAGDEGVPHLALQMPFRAAALSRPPHTLRNTGARPCRTLRGISATNRQCTPQSAPSGASSSPCRGAFLGTAIPKASPARGGVAAGDGGVPHLALQIPFQIATLSRPPHTLRNTGARPFRAAASSRPPPAPCVGADACIGPPSGVEAGCRLRVAARFRPQCRAGVLARRGALQHRRVLRGKALHKAHPVPIAATSSPAGVNARPTI